MSVQLRVDPRKARTFADFGLHSNLLAKIDKKYSAPLEVQKKILALNSSGCSVFAQSVPNCGKSTAAILSVLSTPIATSNSVTNLVSVPTPALVDQYYETLTAFGIAKHIKYLYRTGTPELDEKQHDQFRQHQVTHTLVATPQRILDYITASPNLLAFKNLRQLVIDEIDLFAPGTPIKEADSKAQAAKPVKETPLEILVDYILAQSAPLITASSSSAAPLKNFRKFPDIIKKTSHPMFEIKEPTPTKWRGKLLNSAPRSTLNSEEAYAAELKRIFQGPGLAVVPHNVSSSKSQGQLDGMQVLVTRPAEIAGLNIENLERIYASGNHPPEDIERLKWSMTGEEPKMYVIS